MKNSENADRWLAALSSSIDNIGPLYHCTLILNLDFDISIEFNDFRENSSKIRNKDPSANKVPRLCHMIRLYTLFYIYNDKNKHIKMSDQIFLGQS